MDARDEIRRRQQRWMEEREQNRFKEEIKHDIGNDYESSTDNADPTDMFSKIAAKIDQRIKEKYKAGAASSQEQSGHSEQEQEDTLKSRIMSHTCPICFELLVPPDHAPYILFP